MTNPGARSCRTSILIWLVLVTGLAGGTVAMYQDTYPTSQARAVAVTAAQHNPATGVANKTARWS